MTKHHDLKLLELITGLNLREIPIEGDILKPDSILEDYLGMVSSWISEKIFSQNHKVRSHLEGSNPSRPGSAPEL